MTRRASASDYDEDGVGDACDPYPTAALRLETLATATGLAGVPSEIEWRLVDQDGYPRTDLDGVRAALSLSGGAVFGEAALAGRLVEGGGTSRAVVEVVDALVRLSVRDVLPERVLLDGQDIDRIGLSFGGVLRADFDASDDGFASEPAWPGAADPWRREAPSRGPARRTPRRSAGLPSAAVRRQVPGSMGDSPLRPCCCRRLPLPGCATARGSATARPGANPTRRSWSHRKGRRGGLPSIARNDRTERYGGSTRSTCPHGQGRR